MSIPARGDHADCEPEAEPQAPSAFELPELRILAAPRPGPRAMRVWLGGVVAFFILTSLAAPYLRDRRATGATGALPGGIRSPEAVPPALRPDYDRAVAGDASAMRALGSRCNGQGVPRDTPEGIRWYRLAAAAGSAEAAADLKRLGLAPEI